MRAAPPISILTEPRPSWAAWPCALVGASVAAPIACATAWVGGEPGLQALLAVMALGTGTAAAWVRWPQRGARRLVWNGREWLLDGSPGSVHALADLGGWMLLRHDAVSGQRSWLGVSRSEALAEWHALRCAVHARRPAIVAGGSWA